jgi:hypothetical protein
MITRSPQFIPVFFVTHDITASKRQLMKKRWKNMTIINFCSTATNWGGNRLFLQALDFSALAADPMSSPQMLEGLPSDGERTVQPRVLLVEHSVCPRHLE